MEISLPRYQKALFFLYWPHKSILLITRISLGYVDTTSTTYTSHNSTTCTFLSLDLNLGRFIFRGPSSISHDMQIETCFIYKNAILLVINIILFTFFNIQLSLSDCRIRISFLTKNLSSLQR